MDEPQRPGWLLASADDVPAGDDWLGPRERAVLAGLRVPKRRDDWRLGRFVAKRAVGMRVEIPWPEVEIVASADGAPEAWHGPRRIPWAISFSHRAGFGAVAVVAMPAKVGCDLELDEPRSDAFVSEWLTPSEQALVAGAADPAARSLVANLVWTGKEAAAKLLREGLRLDVRRAEVSVPCGPTGVIGVGMPTGAPRWRPIEVRGDDERIRVRGWWCVDGGLVSTILTDPPSTLPPRRLVPQGDD